MRGEKILQHRVRDPRQSHGEEDSGLKSAVVALLADGKAPENEVATEHARLYGKWLGGEVRPTVKEIAEPAEIFIPGLTISNEACGKSWKMHILNKSIF